MGGAPVSVSVAMFDSAVETAATMAVDVGIERLVDVRIELDISA